MTARPATPLVARPLALVALLAAGPLAAKPRIEIAIEQAKVVVHATGGAARVELQPTQSAAPGETLHYTLRYANKGDEAAVDAVVEDPIPKGTTYVAGSATGEGAEITFSADGGRTFAPAATLTREVALPGGQTGRRTATPAEITHVRWTLKKVAAGAAGQVGFQVKVD